MPTFETAPRFAQDCEKLTDEQRARFQRVVEDQFVPDLEAGRFRPGLRVERVQAAPGVFEVSWHRTGGPPGSTALRSMLACRT
ncbi:hypothetical protein [Salinifilum ghardaiensis]